MVYRSCFRVPTQAGLETIAFCCISIKEPYPIEEATPIIIETVSAYLAETGSKLKVIFTSGPIASTNSIMTYLIPRRPPMWQALTKNLS